MIARVFLLMVDLFIINDLTLAQWISVGKSQSFTCTSAKTDYRYAIRWLLQNKLTSVPLFSCDAIYFRCDPLEDVSVDLYSASIGSNSSSYVSVLTIKNITPSLYKTQVLCIADEQGGSRHIWNDLNVFAIADSPLCDDLTLQNEKNILITCGTQKVFPGSACEFFIKTNASSENKLNKAPIIYSHDQSVTTGYYKTNCSYSVPAALLGPGSHMFRVVMYPNIPFNITDDMKTSSQYTKSIKISYPKALLASNCHVQDYVRENEMIECTCFDDNTSFLPSRLKWSSGNSNINSNSNNATLTFLADRSTISEMNLQCVVSNSLNFTDSIMYLPKVAYPPFMSMKLSNANPDMCTEKNLTIAGSCFVSDSYPESTVSIYIDNILFDANNTSITNQYEFIITYTISGVINVTCIADNGAFYVHRTQYIAVKEMLYHLQGPPEPPSLYLLVKQDRVSCLQRPQQVIIMCRSQGGFPSSKQLTLKCENIVAQARDSDTVSLEVSLGQISMDINCTCDVLHESKCLQNKTTGILTAYVSDGESAINSAAIAVGVILGLCLVGSTLTIIFIVRRNNSNNADCIFRKRENKPTGQNPKNITHNTVQPYVNTDLHQYESVNDNPNYVNVTFCNPSFA